MSAPPGSRCAPPEKVKRSRGAAPVRPAHGVPRRPVSQRGRVLGGGDGNRPDPGRHMHAGVRLLQRRFRKPWSARPGRTRESRIGRGGAGLETPGRHLGDAGRPGGWRRLPVRRRREGDTETGTVGGCRTPRSGLRGTERRWEGWSPPARRSLRTTWKPSPGSTPRCAPGPSIRARWNCWRLRTGRPRGWSSNRGSWSASGRGERKWSPSWRTSTRPGSGPSHWGSTSRRPGIIDRSRSIDRRGIFRACGDGPQDGVLAGRGRAAGPEFLQGRGRDVNEWNVVLTCR
jgi:hypothetical protein